MDRPIRLSPGLELLSEEFLAANRELDSRDDLTLSHYWSLNRENARQYRLRFAQERKIALEQMREDNALLRNSQRLVGLGTRFP